MAVEFWQGQGARAAYGMLGGSWVSDAACARRGARFKVDVGEPRESVWADAMSTRSGVPGYIGLPDEYASAVLRALQGANVNFGSGTLHVTHAAHSRVGSSEIHFGRIATALAKLSMAGEHSSEVLAILEETLIGPAPANPIQALQVAVRRGASLKELFDVVHQECNAEPYQRSLISIWFVRTFDIRVREIQQLASWEGFGGGATVPLGVIEAKFKDAPLKLR